MVQRSENTENSLEQQKTLATLNGLTDPINMIQLEAGNDLDPLATDLPLDLSVPKILYVLDSEEEAVQGLEKDVKQEEISN